ncbi:hypothetical protein F2Q69_00050236 [Brassica cretica]|uniref:RNase H type-1 domain-containing protein n=1 Tax=Brassica cretica TaxID=69181 RepID=A0A8S9PVX4_BRACR|nr:hypothetical protein F2Q69_00050236 [Brassica cretica]
MTSYSWKVIPPYGISINAFPWLCWFIWTSRNQLIFEKKPSTAPEIVARAIIASRECEQEQIHFDAPTAPKISLPSVPFPIHPQTILCNTDAAWKSDLGTGGLAWIFSNEDGSEVGRGSCFQDHISSACMAEALAIRQALLSAIDLNINHICLRSDSQVLVRALESGRRPIDLYGVLSDIVTVSLSSFTSCFFTFVSRDFNWHADSYAKARLLSGPSPCFS